MLCFVSLALALPSVEMRAPAPPRNELVATFDAAAREFGVPRPILLALAWEATHFNPDAETPWGGYGMFDLREGSQDPSLEHAAALLEVDPNTVATDWKLSARGAAAILADQARSSHGGLLPASDDLLAWWDAVRAFSGREEPLLQDQYAGTIFKALAQGVVFDTRWGTVLIDPQDIDLTGRVATPPPTSTDSSLAYQFFAACSDNYSDYSRDSGDIDMIVIHTTEGSYSGTYNWFANCSAEASAHYVVRSSDGQITQMVKEADVAWHAGNWDVNVRSVGIEHEAYVSDCSYYTDAMYQHSADLVVDIATREGVSLDRTHIIGHSEVPDPYNPGEYGGSGHHTDPGSCWDWDYYMSLVNGETGTAGGEIIGVVADSDIYNGTRLVGATVWIGETGDSTTVSSDGYYRFEDVPFGTYTMHASMAGYAEGTCTKTTSSSQDWCSIVMWPEASTGGDDTGDGGDTDTIPVDSGTADTGGPIDEVPDGPPVMPGMKVRMDEMGGCGCDTPGSGGMSWLGLAPLLLLVRRRR